MDDDGVTRLGIEYDQGSVSKAVQTADQIQRSLDKIASSAANIGSSADKMGRTLADALKGISTYTDADAKALDNLRTKLDGVASSAQKAGGFRGEGLRRTGGALTQLGLGEVGGAVSRAGDIAQIVKEADQFAESLGPLGLALPAAAGAAIGYNAALLLLKDTQDKVNAAVKEGISRLDAYYGAVATGDTESTKKRIDSLQREKDAVDKELSVINSSRDNAFTSAQKAYGDLGARILYAAGQTGLYGDALKDTGSKSEDLKKKSQDLGGQIAGLADAVSDGATAAGDAKKAEEELANARRAGIDQGIQRDIQQSKLMRSASSSQVKEEIETRKDEAAAIRDRINLLKMNASKSEEDRKQYEKYQKILDDDEQAIKDLTDVYLPLALAREREAEAIKKRNKDVEDAANYITKQNENIASAYTKYEDDVKAIEDKALQKRADIEKQYADKQIEIARQAADAAKQALQKLEQARADLATTLGRDEEKSERAAAAKRMDIQVTAQREEAKAYQDHQRELEQIRKDAQAREIGFLLDRNFLGLYQSRLQTSQNIDRANQRFVDDRQTRQQGTQQQLQDLQTSLARERQERLIAYQQQLADAQRAYQREIQQAQAKRIEELTIARQKRVEELNDLMATTRAELNARRQKAIEEINMARLTSDARIKLLQAEQAAAIKGAYALTSGASGGSAVAVGGGGGGAGRGPSRLVRTSAYGNALNAGDWSTVNDRFSGQREQYGGIPLPGGLGLFFAMKPGNVTAGGGGAQNTFYITSHDPQGVRREVLGVLEKVMD